MVRTVELIPRQSSLNVNDMKLRVKSGMFSFVASFLFGFGSRLNVQRQREQFSQFVQQELYSSAFGKGSREFGWTFTPMPGTDRLLSGVRTTYAAVIVPEEATSLLLESNGCYFPRDSYQPNNFDDTQTPKRWIADNRMSRNCGQGKAFLVPIPNGGADETNNFWVRSVSYRPVKKGERIVVLVSGSNFSSQIGVLVNGVPLTPAVGLAQPLIRDDSDARRDALNDLKNEKVRGNIERVDANKIVFSFEIPDFEGTPTITLVAPGRAIDINWLENIAVNEFQLARLTGKPLNSCKCGLKPPDCVAEAPWMFGTKPVAVDFKIDSVEPFLIGNGNMKVLIHGAGFKPEDSISSSCPTPTQAPGVAPTPTPTPGSPPARELYINGVRLRFRPVSPALIEVRPFPIPSDEKIQVTLVYGTDTIRSEAINNPARLSIMDTEIIVFEAATKDEPATLVVKIKGTGFTDKLKASIGEVAVKSATEAILTITNPKAAATMVLTDEASGQQVKTIITRKTRSPD